MIRNIFVIDGNNDSFSIKIKTPDTKLLVPINTPSHAESIETSFPNLFKNYNLSPNPIAYDFLRLAISVYSADVRVARDESYDQWTRNFHLYLPVSDVSKWDSSRIQIQDALSFLTGDHWELYFRELDKSSKKYINGKKSKSLNVNSVSLFSGGLDSYCGAIDSLVSKKSVALIGHHSAGGGATSTSQDKTLQSIRRKFGDEIAPFLKIWVSAPKGEDGDSEITTRGRSILFIGLGVFIASGLNVKELVMPENGLISLNVPLSNSRLGSYSTRTTHPYFVKLVADIIKAVGLDVELNLIYRFKTKGEMLLSCLDKDLLLLGLKDTMSCSHPSAGRYAKIKGNPHCGYCLPCIVRRAAIWKALEEDDTKYAYGINDKKLTANKMMDQKSILMALVRQKSKSPNIADILVSGPLPVSDEAKMKYLDVYKRGMQEIKEFMSEYVSI